MTPPTPDAEPMLDLAAIRAAALEDAARVCDNAQFTMGSDPVGATILATVAAAIRALGPADPRREGV